MQLYHEFGYDNARTGTHVPARPVFKAALDESEKEVFEVLDEATGAVLIRVSAAIDDAVGYARRGLRKGLPRGQGCQEANRIIPR